jgi:hypothetical protein
MGWRIGATAGILPLGEGLTTPEGCLKLAQSPCHNSLAQMSHEGYHHMKVMDGHQAISQELPGHEEMVEVGSGEMLTGVAGTAWFKGTRIVSQGGPQDAQAQDVGVTLSIRLGPPCSWRDEGCPIAGPPGGGDAIKHVHATPHTGKDVFDLSNPQEMTRSLLREERDNPLKDGVHIAL